MSRPFRIVVAVLATVAATLLYLSVTLKVRSMTEPITFTRNAVDFPTLVAKGYVFFAPLDPATAPMMDAVAPLIRWVVILLIGVSTYLACGLVTRRTHPFVAAMTGAAAALTATAIGDLLWWATFVLRVHSAPAGWYANEALDHSTLLASAHLTLTGWTSDALFFGCLFAGMNASLVGCTSLAILLLDRLNKDTDEGVGEAQDAVDGEGDGEAQEAVVDNGAPVPLIGDVRRRSANLALAGVLPVLVLVLVNGTQAVWDSYSDRGFLTLLRVFLYRPALSLPPGGRDDVEYRLTHEVELNPLSMDVWAHRSVLAVALLLVLWLLLWALLSGLPNSGHRLGLVVVCWGATIAASALTATSDVLVDCAVTDSPTGCAPWQSLGLQLTSALRFGAAWGWLVALPVLLARRLLDTDTSTDTSTDTQETPVHEST
ncbi:hypothetical protein AB0J94_18845 [Micromonospora noduli]|uniref:Uncharacterized protein n=1 Tax=Micromonospora noduli TaxID=709876 RepID=A0A328MYM3_9ACTN|nr:hypothetical protein [Micromonospora noduli]RAN96109.1 hypothetical protein LAH08_04851 [Micromonospora noduli]RAO16658.1 hypothetical protein MED15_03706 [Micromonospora noduli]RAO23825.1 hypothetical protein LUPAC07_00227 [Micromonospora noduli]RAO32369.1 hypothetical protein ONO23_03266 [Micromonospora noduli]RAO49465.1 hypothetical protein ONO86_02524 [Micromonospora noduli]